MLEIKGKILKRREDNYIQLIII